MTARFDLVREIAGHGVRMHDAEAIADSVMAEGWRPPARRVETVEELDALPVGSVVRSDWPKAAEPVGYVSVRFSDGWFTPLHQTRVFPLGAGGGTVTVLWESGDPR